MSNRGDIKGELRIDAPHVKLAGLRLKQLAREIDDGLANSSDDVTVSTQAFSTALTFAAIQIRNSLALLAADVQRLGDHILLASDSVKVADVDRACGDLRLRVRDLFALRNACHPHRFADWENPLVLDARTRIAGCLRNFARYCTLVSAMILHADRMQADGSADIGVSLDLDLAHQLAAIAARARRPIPLWRYQ
ncbi:MAG TPA: hypothetical protein PKC15_14255 [Rhodocyclaceae bacterium]|nr:hypothetical protein [Rhodocyclaceae bacterium]